MKQYKFREFRKIVEKNGFSLVRTKGDHFIFERDGDTLTINQKPNICVCTRLIKEFGLVV